MRHDRKPIPVPSYASCSRAPTDTNGHSPVTEMSSALRDHIRTLTGPAVVCTYQVGKQANGQHQLQALPVHYTTNLSNVCGPPKTPELYPVLATESVETVDFRNQKGMFSLLVDEPNSEATNNGCTHITLPCKSLKSNSEQPSLHDQVSNSTAAGHDAAPATSPLPIEIFDNIIQYLSLGDVKNLRLVGKDFERGVSANLFRSIVVPFNKDIFGVLSRNVRHPSKGPLNHVTAKGKGRQTGSQTYRDLDIFRGFGSHVRQFAISFEVNEAALLEPPVKDFHQGQTAFWGDFEWPNPDYCRFSDRASLELMADETSTMTLAFSHLTQVQHLALSLDAGLGWIDGPDKSLRSLLLADPSPIFRDHGHQTPGDLLSRRRFWVSLEHWFASGGRFHDLQRGAFVQVDAEKSAGTHDSIVQPCLLPYQVLTESLSTSATTNTTNSTITQSKSDETPMRNRDARSSSTRNFRQNPSHVLTRLSRSMQGTCLVNTPVQYDNDDYGDDEGDDDDDGDARFIQRSPTESVNTASHDANRNEMPDQGSSADNRANGNLTSRLTAGAIRRSFHRLDSHLIPEKAGPSSNSQDSSVIKRSVSKSSPTFSSPSSADDAKPTKITEGPRALSRKDNAQPESESGYLCIQGISANEYKEFVHKYKLNPTCLTRPQKEWLLETAWAQDAFLSSYMLAVLDNGNTFSNVTKLTFSSVSSRHIPKLQRHDFWGALPCLVEVDIRVIADWQDVHKGSSGNAEMSTLRLSDALNSFHSLLKTTICRQFSIRRLTIGWVGGGEHAEGVLARNMKVLPAPVVNAEDVDFSAHQFASTVVFFAVETLTFVNCWFTPVMFKHFIKTHSGSKMKELILDSVSLTADTRILANERREQANAQAQLITLMQNYPNHLPHHLYSFGRHQAVAATSTGNVLRTRFGRIRGPLQGNTQPLGYFPSDNQNSTRENLLYPLVGHGNHSRCLSTAPGDQWRIDHPYHHAAVLVQTAGLGPQASVFQGGNNPAIGRGPFAGGSRRLRRNCWPEIFEWAQEYWDKTTEQPLTLRLRSVGYVRLHGVRFEQSGLEDRTQHIINALVSNPLNTTTPEAFFAQRATALAGVMMSSNESFLGNIVTVLPPDEEDELLYEWNMERGWPKDRELQGADYDDDDGWGRWGEYTKRAALYDGNRPGGWGRFSGIVELHDDESDSE